MAKRNQSYSSYSVDLPTTSGPGPGTSSRVATQSTATVNF